jgi:hypothetical protein
MKKQYTISVEVTASTKENAQAFDALVADTFETLKKHVASLDNLVTVKTAIAEVNAVPAPAPPAAPKV